MIHRQAVKILLLSAGPVIHRKLSARSPKDNDGVMDIT